MLLVKFNSSLEPYYYSAQVIQSHVSVQITVKLHDNCYYFVIFLSKNQRCPLL